MITDEELTAIYKTANGEDIGKAQPLTTRRIFRAMRACIDQERERCTKICRDHADEDSPPFKESEDTYMNGWIDASNGCVWEILGQDDPTNGN